MVEGFGLFDGEGNVMDQVAMLKGVVFGFGDFDKVGGDVIALIKGLGGNLPSQYALAAGKINN